MGNLKLLIKLHSEYRFDIAAVPIIVQALLLNGFGVGMGVTVGIIALNIVIGNIIEPKMIG